MKRDFDVIVIGAGSGGLTAAIGFSKIGKKVLLVERAKMGGECTNSGCIPSKSLIHHARRYAEAKVWAGETDQLKAYRANILQLVRRKIDQVACEESAEVLERKYGIAVIFGRAEFKNANFITIHQQDGDVTQTAKIVVIASGSSARKMEIPGLEPEKTLTNENLFELKDIPKKLLVIGGGPIGCEIAQAFNHLGTKISMIVHGETIVPREEAMVASMTQERFLEQGIEIFPRADLKSCEGGYAMVEQKKDGASVLHKIPYDHVLMAIGRVPNLSELNLGAAGIAYTESGITVDHHYRTNRKKVFAIGDVASALKFTHTAEDQGRHVFKKCLFPWLSADDSKPVPRVTYLDQEIASVGVTSLEAEEKYGKRSVVTISIPYESSDRAKTDDAGKGVAIVIAKRMTGKILGATLMGTNAGELISVFTLAIQYRISLYKLNTMIVPYPVLGQLYKSLSDAYIGETLAHWKRDLKFLLRKNFLFILTTLLLLISLVIFLNR